MKMRLEINIECAAFEDDMEGELGRILLKLHHDIAHGGGYSPNERHKLRDSNGNTVGHVEFTEE